MRNGRAPSRSPFAARRQAMLLGISVAVVGALFLLPSSLVSRLPFFVFAPAVALAAWASGNAHAISGAVYFLALVLQVYVLANALGYLWAVASNATAGAR